MTPAMRITVQNGMVMEQVAFGFQNLQDMLIGTEHMFASKQLGAGQEHAIAAHRIVNGQVVFQANDIVILAVAWRSMHRTCTRLGCHMVAEDDRYLPVVKGMLQ